MRTIPRAEKVIMHRGIALMIEKPAWEMRIPERRSVVRAHEPTL